jgi:GT2 family glycosyltransferase
VSGACLLIRRRAWEDVGPFDERFWLYSEEVDWAKRAQERGWQILLLPQTLASHIGGVSSAVSHEEPERVEPARNWLLEMQLAYLAKHHGRVAAASYRLAAAAHRRARSWRRGGRG